MWFLSLSNRKSGLRLWGETDNMRESCPLIWTNIKWNQSIAFLMEAMSAIQLVFVLKRLHIQIILRNIVRHHVQVATNIHRLFSIYLFNWGLLQSMTSIIFSLRIALLLFFSLFRGKPIEFNCKIVFPEHIVHECELKMQESSNEHCCYPEIGQKMN